MSAGKNGETKKNLNGGITPERRKRINRLKKIIICVVLCMILIPTMGCIILGIRLYQTSKSVETMSEQISFLESVLQESVDEMDETEVWLENSGETWRGTEGEQESETLPEEGALGENSETAEETRKVYLTFDDGPSIYTEELLDILAEYDVKATFFVTGKEKEGYGDTYRRIVEEGHTLGMHSYSHEYSNIYASLENFQEDFETLQNFLYNETGVASRYYRFPGGSSNKVSKTDIHQLIAYLNAMDISYFDWNISAGDATSTPVSSEQIVNRVMSEIPSYQEAVVLMHDAADKRSTVDALPMLIEKIQAMGDETEILPITEETKPVQHISDE